MTTSNRAVTRVLASGWILTGMASVLVGGCDLPPRPPTTADGRRVESVMVNPADEVEASTVGRLLSAEGRYEQALKVLHAHYLRTGSYDKQRWADSEMKNLAAARTWRYEGVAAPPAPAGQSVADRSEAALAEQVLTARGAWQGALQTLADHYKTNGLGFKLALIRNVQQRFDPVRAYSYFLHAEVPPATLSPTDVIPAADELFDKALRLHRRGKPLPAVTDYRKQREALGMFLDLVRRYPASTRIAESAFYIAEIYKEYFRENIRAVQWYRRAWQWDPRIMKPARFQAAVIYDLRLAQYGKAVELYREVLKHEQFNRSNVSFATNRLAELTAR